MSDFNVRESEISPKQIFEQMKNNIFNNFSISTYSSINKAYLYARRSLFKILHAITNAMNFKSQTFFLCTHYLDIIFSSQKSINININLLGLASLSLSAKFCENDPIVPHLQYFIKVYNVIMGYRSVFSMNDLKTSEIFVLNILNYKLNYFTSYDFNSFLFGHGILKLEQLREIGTNKNERYYRNKRKEFVINQTNSLMIKNILEKIYRKSRYYLDIIINKTKLCFKYNALILSIYIMKKSVIEILAIEHKINFCGIDEQEEFYKRNSKCFKEIMFEFYKIEYESNEQYKELVHDEELLEVFEKKVIIKNGLSTAASLCESKIEEKKDDEKENNKINNNNENKTLFASSVSNGFYKRLTLKINSDEISKRHYDITDRNTITSRAKNSITVSNDNTFDNINSNLNINELQNTYKKRDISKSNLSYANRSALNIYSSYKNKHNEELPTNILKKKITNIPISNKYIPRIETYNNLNKRKIFRNNNDLNYTENTYQESNYLSKKEEIKTEKTSPMKSDEISINHNFLNYSKMYKIRKINRLNNGKERKDYSYSTTENNNNNDLSKKSYEKKPYFKKLIRHNTNEYASLNFNSTNNFNSNIEKNKFETIDLESLSRNKNNNTNLKTNNFYTRINLRKPTSDRNSVFNTSINTGNENTFKKNNNINDKKELITTSSRFRRRYFHNNTNINNDISGDIKTENAVILKDDNNKKEIESYSQTKAINNKGLTSLNFYNNKRTKISVNTIKNNDNKSTDTNNNKSFVETKRITHLLGKQNIELNNTLKEINLAYVRNKNEEKEREKEKEKEREKEKEKEREKENKISTSNNSKDINNNNIKVNFTKSIRQKYLNINKNNRSSNNLNKNNEEASTENNKTNEYNSNYDSINTNNISISIKNRYTSKNKINNIIINNNYNLIENKMNNDGNDEKRFSNTKENTISNVNSNSNIKYSTNIPIPNHYQDLKKTSMYKIINKTRTLFTRNNNKEEEKNKSNKDNNDNDRNEYKTINNNSSINYFKSQNKNNKIIKSEKNLEIQRNKEEIIKNQQDKDKKFGNNSYLRNIVYKNRLNKNNININYRSQKNTSNILFSNNLNMNNNENKNRDNNSNILSEYVKYKNIYIKNNAAGQNINNSFVMSKNDNNLFNKKYVNRFVNYNSNNNNGNDRSSVENAINKFHVNRRIIDELSNNNNDNYYKVIFNGK